MQYWLDLSNSTLKFRSFAVLGRRLHQQLNELVGLSALVDCCMLHALLQKVQMVNNLDVRLLALAGVSNDLGDGSVDLLNNVTGLLVASDQTDNCLKLCLVKHEADIKEVSYDYVEDLVDVCERHLGDSQAS